MTVGAGLLGNGLPVADLSIGDQKEITGWGLGRDLVTKLERGFDFGAPQICVQFFAEGL